MTTPESNPGTGLDLAASTDVEAGAGGGVPDERPATSDPELMVDTPDSLGGTGANTGGAG